MYIVLFHLYKVEEQAQVNNLGLRNARRGGKVTKKNRGTILTVVRMLILWEKAESAE